MSAKRRKRLHEIDTGMWPMLLVVTDDRDAYSRFVRKHGLTGAGGFPTDRGVNGNAQFFPSIGTFVIAVDPERQGEDLVFTLLHEAVHVADHLFEYIGESAPGTETRAYLIEWITRSALHALEH